MEAESQTSDQSQPIHEINGDDVGDKAVGAPPDAAGIEPELGKKKRGRPPRVQAKSPPTKLIKEDDEDVCFICFDGGSLVLCDRRGCPKAYHPACVKRDEAFFQSKAKWNCGWHICSKCQRAAHHMCYTCTYSLCKGCIKNADYVCVRGDKGFCTMCMKTIMLIENDGQEKDEKAQVDFDDKTSWEYLFKVYWVYLKGKLSLTLDELKQAKNPWKGATTTTLVTPSTVVHSVVNDSNPEASESKRRKTDELTSIPQKETVITKKTGTGKSSYLVAHKDWATKELLDFVAHMKNGDTSVLSQFDVQELMLEYIKRNNLRDPRKKSQIICDTRLKVLFGKPRVGHFEMLKLLEYHYFLKEDVPKNPINSIASAKHIDPDWNSDNMLPVGKDKKRKNHKKIEERTPENKLDEYAAIDIHNMNLIYLRRKFMENLVENNEEFQKKVVGSIVRIRISGSDLKHDMYRLVQVVGTSKADAPYKIGDKSTNFKIEVSNLDKKETVSIDTISNQDLSEDECRRLRQSIRCGLVKRFTVGEIQDKAVSLQSVRLNDMMEAETLRLNNLRDRASEKGHKKSLREYVEKLQLLKTPEERERRLREIPEVHSDPKMNPDYESDDTEEYFNKEHEEQTKPNFSGIIRKNKYPGISRDSAISPKKQADYINNVGSRSRKNEEGSIKALGRIHMKKDPHGSSSLGRPQNQVDINGSSITNRNHNTTSEAATSSYSTKNNSISNDSELEKLWHYRDPSGKVQGPFCMVQLQKWSTTGYFPQDMRIWTNREDESFLLNDVLKEQLHNKTATEKVGIRIERLTVRTTNLSRQNSANHDKLSDTHGSVGQASVQKWIANGNALSFGKSSEPDALEMASPTPVENNCNIKNVSSGFNIKNADHMDLPSPTPKEMTHADEKVKSAPESSVQETNNVGGTQLPETGNEWRASPAPKETTHEDEKVINAPQISVQETKNVDGELSPETGTERKASPAPKETTYEDEKVKDASIISAQESKNVVGTQTSETGNEWRATPRAKEITHEDETVKNAPEILAQESKNVGGTRPLETGNEWRESPTPKEMTHEDEVKNAPEILAQESKNVGGTRPLETGNEWRASPTPKETTHEDEVKNAPEILAQESKNVGGTRPLETGNEWSGYSPTQVKQEEWPLASEHVVTTASVEQVIPSSSQPGYNSLPPWQGVHETIEFSTLAEESVSDLLAEVDAMESQNGFPSPTSRRNSFVEDLFNGSFEDFSPTPDQSASSNPFSSSGVDLHLPFQPSITTTTATTTSAATLVETSQGNTSNVFDFGKSSTDLQLKWPEVPRETISEDAIDVNNSANAEADKEERESKTGYVQIEENSVQMRPDQITSETSYDLSNSNEHKEGDSAQPTTTKSEVQIPKLALEVRTDHPEAADGIVQPTKVDAVGPPAQPHLLQPTVSSTIAVDKTYSHAVGQEAMQGNISNFVRPAQEVITRVNPHSNASWGVNVGWDPPQRPYVGERYNNNSMRERSYKVEDSGYSRNGKPWVRQSSFGSGSVGGGVGVGGYLRPPSNGKRVCKFYESGRCKRGASCNYWHP
uniref:zinc finger CCCH domain-containing protein 44-like n=1 Tax=Erigeron canadensis TaxID=72917 RepID=UPI001CB8E175|nr:zinc finger CCCH domain-containing protein 44-like [Erigeron canadensis]